MPDASITSTESTFGTISGTFTADQSTISGTITAITGTVDGSVGVPGPTGPTGPTGPAGAPGVGVPAGGLTGQFLTKSSNLDYATGWSTLSLSGYATESWVTAGFYPLSGNPSGFLTSAALTPYLTKADNLGSLTNFATARDNLGLGLLYSPTFAGLTLQGSGANVGQYTPTSLTLTHATYGSFVIQPSAGITFPDTSVQTTAFVAGSGLPTGGTVGQVLTKNSGSNFDASFATLIPGDRYLTTSTTSLTINNANKTLTIGTGLSYTPTQNITISYDASHHMHGEVLTYNSGTGVLTVDINHHTGSGTYAAWVVNVGGVTPATSVAWGAITGTLSAQTDLQIQLDSKFNQSGGTISGPVTLPDASALTTTVLGNAGLIVSNDNDPAENVEINYSGLLVKSATQTLAVYPGQINFPDSTIQTTAFIAANYAAIAGATFTGKVNGTPSATTAAFNIGTVTAAPTTLVNGDIWITDRLAFRNRFGNTITGLTNNQTNTITTSSDAAFILGITQGGNGGGLRVVNNGTGDSFRVEDETPESTPFVISNTGRVGIGVAPDATAALKVDAGGIKFNDGTTQTTAPVAGPTYVNVQVFGGPASSGSFTWNKPTGAKSVEVLMMSGGGGGGSGARQATTAGRFGGGGGGGAGGIYFKLDADALASSETVTVGAGGAGGAAVTTDTTNGNPGTKGGDSVFGPITCRGGNFGGGGTDTTGAAGATSLWYQWISSIQTVNNRGGVAPAAAPGISYELFTCATGGGGGASRLANVTLPSGGGAGGNKLASAGGGVESGLTSAIVGGAGGLGGTSTPPVAGTNGTEYWGGTGGGGGYYRTATVGNPGAAGGWPGGGGGGGGSSDNTFNSGAGAAGGNGVVLIISYCS